MRQRAVTIVFAFLVGAITAGVHWPVLSAQAESFDDSYYLAKDGVVANPGWASIRRAFAEMTRPTGVPGYAHPLAMLSLMGDYALGGRGGHLQAFHCTSLALHVMNVVLVMVLLQRLLGMRCETLVATSSSQARRGRDAHATQLPGGTLGPPVVAALVGLLFGLHPLTVEPVAWIAQRKTLLAGAFSLWCMVLYVYWVGRRGRGLYIGSLLMYVLATLSKPSAVPVPFLLLVLDFWPLKRLGWQCIKEKVPFFAVAVGASALALSSQLATAETEVPLASKWSEAAALVGAKLVLFAVRLVWGGAASCYHPPPDYSTAWGYVLGDVVRWSSLLLVLIVISVRFSRGAVAGLLFFLVAAAPMLGIVQYSQVFFHDSYDYLPLLGPLLVIGGFSAAAVGWIAGRRRYFAAVVLIAAWLGLAVSEAGATRGYLREWRGRTDLYRYMIAVAPTEWILENNLGAVLDEEGQTQEAVRHFRQALRFSSAPRDEVRVRYNLGDALVRLGRMDEAVEQYAAAFRPVPRQLETLHDHAVKLAMQGRLEKARALMLAGLAVRPQWPEAHNNLGNVLKDLGLKDEALVQYAEAVRQRPEYVDARMNRAILLDESGSIGDAAQEWAEVLRLQPGKVRAQAGLADALLRQGKYAEAADAYMELLRSVPGDFEARSNLGRALRESGRAREALRIHTDLLMQRPDEATARFELGQDWEALGDDEAAAAAYRELLRTEPGHDGARRRLAALGAAAGQ